MDAFDALKFALSAPPVEGVEPESLCDIPLDEDSQYWRPGTFCVIS